MLENTNTPAEPTSAPDTSTAEVNLADLFAPEQSATPDQPSATDTAIENAIEDVTESPETDEPEVPSIFADDEPEPEPVKATDTVEPAFDAEAFLGTLDAPEKLTALKPEQLQAVAPQLYQRWQEASPVLEAARQIEEKVGIAMEFVPQVVETVGPLLYGNGIFNPESGETGIQAFMQRLYDYGVSADEAATNPGAVAQGQLYTSLLGNMLKVELDHLEQLQPAADGQLPFLVQHAYKPILKHLLGTDVNDETLETLKQVAQYGLPAQKEGGGIEPGHIKATLALVPDQSLHQYWRRLTPSQQAYLVQESVPPADVIATLEQQRDLVLARQSQEEFKAEKERIQKESLARLDAEKTQQAEAVIKAELDKIIGEGGKLFADTEQEKWRTEQIRDRVMAQLQTPQHKRMWDQYVELTKQGNTVMANSALTKLIRTARAFRAAESDRWNKIKPVKAKPKAVAATTSTANGQPQFKAQAAPGGEDWENINLTDLMFGRQ